jgi:thioredoxin 1
MTSARTARRFSSPTRCCAAQGLADRDARRALNFRTPTASSPRYHAVPAAASVARRNSRGIWSKESSMAGAATLTITESNYQSEVVQSQVPVLIDFWAEWCQPCRMIGPSIDQLAAEYQGKAKVGKVDIDTNRNLALQFNVQSIPCVIVLKGGQVVAKTQGVKPKAEFAKMLDAAL